MGNPDQNDLNLELLEEALRKAREQEQAAAEKLRKAMEEEGS